MSSTTTKAMRKRSKDGTFRGGARPGAGRKPRGPAELEPEIVPKPTTVPEPPPNLDDDAYAVDLLSRVMRDGRRSLAQRV